MASQKTFLPLERSTTDETFLPNLEFIPALLSFDKRERIQSWNFAEERMFHREAKETIGRPLMELGILIQGPGGQKNTLLKSATQLSATETQAQVTLPEGLTRILGLRTLNCGKDSNVNILIRDLGPELRDLKRKELTTFLFPAISLASATQNWDDILDKTRQFFGASFAFIFEIRDIEEKKRVHCVAANGGGGLTSVQQLLQSLLSSDEVRRRLIKSGFMKSKLPEFYGKFAIAVQDLGDEESAHRRLLVLVRPSDTAPWSTVDAAVLADFTQLVCCISSFMLIPSRRTSSNKYLESIMRSSDLGILFIEKRDGTVIMSLANRMFFEFFGIETAEFSGGSIKALEQHLLSCVVDPANARENLISHFESADERSGELTTKLPTHRILQVFSAPSIEGEKNFSRIILFRDITRDKEIEQQLLHSQKMESIGTLAGGIAHDFNNLLTTMLGYAELLKAELPPGQPSHVKVEQIERSARRAAELTSNLLAFSRRKPSQTTVCDLGELVKEAIALVRFSMPSSIEIKTNIAQNIPFVEADPTQIQQVLINLMLNARDALPEKGGCIVVSTEAGEDSMNPVIKGGPRYAVIEVEDNGSGIPKECLPRIFEPFYTTKEVGKGTGLGLAMVYGIVKGHGGFIEVSSAPDCGSIFSVFLPETKKPPLPPMLTPQHVEQTVKTAAHVLVVDDEPDLLQFCRSALEPLCGQVQTASDGLEALTLVEAAPEEFDLVILDLTMPRMGGVECFYRMRRLSPQLKIIITSGYNVKGGPEALLESGAVAFLQKPYSVNSLIKTVKNQLKG